MALLRGVRNKVYGISSRIYLYSVNIDEINKIKGEYKSNGSLISTNDILCSWLGGVTSDMVMFVDPRGRVAELTMEMVGNYQISIPISWPDVDNPKEFRERLLKILANEVRADNVTPKGAVSSVTTLHHE